MQRLRDELRGATIPALALLTAFLLGAVVIVVTDVDSLRQLLADPPAAIGGAFAGMLRGYAAMFSGAIGNPGDIAAALRDGSAEAVAKAIRPLSETLLFATPFIFAGLGLAVSFRAGLFNLGVDGQFIVGGVGTSITAILVAGHLPPLLALVVAVAGGTAAGGLYGFLPGILKARTGAHEVITTLMLNGIAPNLAFLVFGMLSIGEPPAPVTGVATILDLRTIRVDYGFVVALGMAVLVSWWLFRTTPGLELRATGLNATAARAAGIQTRRTTVLAMSLSGALVGMGSAFYALGPALGTGGGSPFEFGYLAIALALLGGRRPSGIVAAAILYGALNTGAKNMVVATGVPLALLMVIVAFAIVFVAAPNLTRAIWRLRVPTPGAETGASPPAGPALSGDRSPL